MLRFSANFLYEFKLNRSAAERARKINQTFSNDTVTERNVRRGFAKFRSGDFCLEDEPQSGRPTLTISFCLTHHISQISRQPTTIFLNTSITFSPVKPSSIRTRQKRSLSTSSNHKHIIFMQTTCVTLAEVHWFEWRLFRLNWTSIHWDITV